MHLLSQSNTMAQIQSFKTKLLKLVAQNRNTSNHPLLILFIHQLSSNVSISITVIASFTYSAENYLHTLSHSIT